MSRRIRRDTAHEEFVARLTAGENPIFKEKWQLLMLAASIGLNASERRPLDHFDSGKAMPPTYFGPGLSGFLYLMGVAESGGSDCLHSNDEEYDKLVTAFEEYANAGLWKLRERLDEKPEALEELTTFLIESSAPALPAADLDSLAQI